MERYITYTNQKTYLVKVSIPLNHQKIKYNSNEASVGFFSPVDADKLILKFTWRDFPGGSGLTVCAPTIGGTGPIPDQRT